MPLSSSTSEPSSAAQIGDEPSSAAKAHDDHEERRLDIDCKPYTYDEFVARYGRSTEWDDAELRPHVERRLDSDGRPYMLRDFIEFHGSSRGREYWESAARADPPPQHLTVKLKASKSAEALLDLHRRHMGGMMNNIHVITCWARLGELTFASASSGGSSPIDAVTERRWLRRNPRELSALRDHTLAMLHLMDERGLSTTAHGIAAANLTTLGPWWRTLLDALAAEAVPRLEQMSARDMSQLAYAFARAEQINRPLFAAIDDEATARVGEFSDQALCNLAWAYATNRHRAPSLFDAIAREAVPRIPGFAPAGLASMAWAFAMARPRHDSPKLFDAIATAALRSPASIGTFRTANLLWSFARARHPAPELFEELAVHAEPALDGYSSQDLARVVWAFVQAQHHHPHLFDAIAESAHPRASTFRPQDVATMAWGFARVRHTSASQARLFDALADEARSNIHKFRPQALATTAWAFAESQHPAPEMFDAIAGAVWQMGSGAFRDVRAQTMLEKAFDAVGIPVPEFEDDFATARRHQREAAGYGPGGSDPDRRSVRAAAIDGQQKDGKPQGAQWPWERFVHERATEAHEAYFEQPERRRPSRSRPEETRVRGATGPRGGDTERGE
jgi:hypothetical protein